MLSYLFIVLLTFAFTSGQVSKDINKAAFANFASYNLIGARYKYYYVPLSYTAAAADQKSICKSYDMDVLALETAAEADNFYKVMKANANLFDSMTLTSGLKLVYPNNTYTWFWTKSGNQIVIPINLRTAKSAEDDEPKNCLAIGKYSGNEFKLAEVGCNTRRYKFICTVVF